MDFMGRCKEGELGIGSFVRSSRALWHCCDFSPPFCSTGLWVRPVGAGNANGKWHKHCEHRAVLWERHTRTHPGSTTSYSRMKHIAHYLLFSFLSPIYSCTFNLNKYIFFVGDGCVWGARPEATGPLARARGWPVKQCRGSDCFCHTAH